jgi:hypothetical protein
MKDRRLPCYAPKQKNFFLPDAHLPFYFSYNDRNTVMYHYHRGGFQMKVRAITAAAILSLGLAGAVAAADWATAEGSCYAKGDKLLSVGAALYPFGLFGAFDYGLHDCISLGGAAGFMVYPYGNPYIPVVVRGAFHPFNLKVLSEKIKVRDKLDVYVGPSVGWEIGLGWLGLPFFREYIGVRYKLNDKFMLFAEDCAGLGYLSAGITFKL